MPSPDVGIAEAAKAIRDDILTIRMDNALRLDDHLDSHWIDVLCERAARAAYASLRAATAPVAPVRGDGGAVPETFRTSITRELGELGLVPDERALAAAYAIWTFARPDGVSVLIGPTEQESFGYAWRALKAVGIAAAPTPDSQQTEGTGDV